MWAYFILWYRIYTIHDTLMPEGNVLNWRSLQFIKELAICFSAEASDSV